MMKSSCRVFPPRPPRLKRLSRAGQLEALTRRCREKVLLRSSVPRAAPFHELQRDKVLPSWDSFKRARLYFRDCQQGGTSLILHPLKPEQTETFQRQIHIPTGGASPLGPVLRVPLKRSSIISSKAGGKKYINLSNTITDAPRNPVPSPADVMKLLKAPPGYSLAALSREIIALPNEGQYCPSII